ncbi:MAG: helix-turn-helix domain-containing protein [Akkermansiaceae bacterium]
MDKKEQQQRETHDEPMKTQLYEYLLHSELFSIYRKSFEKVTGHTMALIHPDVNETPIAEVGRCGNAYCAILLANDICSKRCLDHTRKLASRAVGSSSTAQCSAKMTTTLIPVNSHDKTVAYLRTGQVKVDLPTVDFANLDEIQKNLPLSVGADLEKAYNGLTNIDEKKYLDHLVVLGAFAMQLSCIAEKAVDRTHSDSILTDRCKQYITANLSEKICLDSLAEHTKVTNSYMCKQFKKHTGMTIVEYINLHRIELAKQLLIERDGEKIINIAYECGFQSLSQFNRTFQKFVDSSPTGYRKRASVCAAGSCDPRRMRA